MEPVARVKDVSKYWIKVGMKVLHKEGNTVVRVDSFDITRYRSKNGGPAKSEFKGVWCSFQDAGGNTVSRRFFTSELEKLPDEHTNGK